MPIAPMCVAAAETACKCCGGASRLCGVLDFSVGGADRFAGRKVDPYVGLPVYYHRCERCGFVFTRAFDAWTPDDFAAHIYNDDYPRQDPDCTGARARDNAAMIARHFPSMAGQPTLDFGSGFGQLEHELAARGFGAIASWDPYHGTSRAQPADGAYRNILAFEVFEHHPDPHALVATLLRYLDDDGAILVSTLLVSDAQVEAGIADWWYCLPRNGHISLFSDTALRTLADAHGLRMVSFNDGLHLFHRNAVPRWAAQYVASASASAQPA